VTPLGLEPRTY